MIDHVRNRNRIIEGIRAELVGPAPAGDGIDCRGKISFPTAAEAFQPRIQLDSGEEILQRDGPMKRYGAGILYPAGAVSLETDEGEAEVSQVSLDAEGEGPVTPEATEDIETIQRRGDTPGTEPSDDFDLRAANRFRPSSLGLSFLVDPSRLDALLVTVRGGVYRPKTVTAGEDSFTWWLRSPVEFQAVFAGADLRAAGNRRIRPESLRGELQGLDMRVELFARSREQGRFQLFTGSLINRSAMPARNESCLFQTHLSVTGSPEEGFVLPYPTTGTGELDEEEESMALLYRKAWTYAVGHGCATDWGAVNSEGRASHVSAECLPCCEIPNVTTDITALDGSPVDVAIATLAGLVPEDDGLVELERLVDEYGRWIGERHVELGTLATGYRITGQRHLEECRVCEHRMRAGLSFLKTDEQALRAFRMANLAILLQQVHSSRREPRRISYDRTKRRIAFSEPYEKTDLLEPPGGPRKWRPFQIAFLLMTLQSAAIGDSDERRSVELIWFPTGGGKTEAYLALAAFSMFYRRLTDRDDTGTQVIMRYTLRLLTTQQFQRAAGLLCAMEDLRRSVPRLGDQRFSIGIWLGRDTTPNQRMKALSVLRGLQAGDRQVENQFILTRCPWCGCQMGPVHHPPGTPRSIPRVFGYKQRESTVVLKCPDPACEFSEGLPIYVIDEDIYEIRPTLIIGTVDKFALLAWKPAARSLFGLDAEGQRVLSPPGLIIQDELHLISGPLGSMVGLYETVIEELCTDRRNPLPVSPKIVCSTATIRRYKDQIKGLYARDHVVLFPPPGLDADDSFFARSARTEEGDLAPGKLYVGVNAPGLGSLQTVQVRTYAALLQAPFPLEDEGRDPWWSLLIFFNSLRELGGALTLFQSDIPDYFRVYHSRTRSKTRFLRIVKELTGRLRSDEIPAAIADLEVSCLSKGSAPVDVCLASSIIEVGIDIDRLSLMVVVGQPKTTSQYIQVTGRIGRRWWERPGLVVTLYSASKPRDRSHFERFRSYHDRLYAQVEPSSVTPFSPPVLDRALHAIMAAYARQADSSALAKSPYPFPDGVMDTLEGIILPRIKAVDPKELSTFRQVFSRRRSEWKRWERYLWQGSWSGEDIPLLRPAGSYASPTHAKLSWATPLSLRNVDAEAQVEITRLYLDEEGEDA